MKRYAVTLIVLVIFTICLAGYKTFLSLSHPIKFKNEILEASQIYGIEPALIASIINTESSFNENSKSNKNAIGLMQIKLSTANYLNDITHKNDITENELFEPKTNISYGCEYLKYLINKFKDPYTALAAYNAGETRVKSWLNSSSFSNDKITLKNIPYSETKNYIEKIKSNLKIYKKIFN